MAQSVRDKITAKAVEVLNAPAGKPATAFRSRTDALSQVEGQAKGIVVYPMKESGETAGRTVSLRTMTLRFETMTAGDAPQDQALDEVLVYITQTLYASQAFLDMTRRITEVGIEWQFEGGELELGFAAVDFEVQYTVQVDDPTIAK
jgi:hypothetical protein